MKDRTAKTTRPFKGSFLTMLAGIIFISIMLAAVFGARSRGVYSIARVERVEETTESDFQFEEIDKSWIVDLKITAGEHKDKSFLVTHYEISDSPYSLTVKPGDRVLAVIDKSDENSIVGIDEFFRSDRILLLIIIILLLTAAVAGYNGISAMIALFFTLLIVFLLMAGLLLRGYPPLILGVAAAVLIISINILFIIGWNPKAFIALWGTVGGVFCAGLFGKLAGDFLRLSGYTGSESTYLQILASEVDLQGILVCGMIIGSLGAVMDVAVSIASSIQEINLANPGYTTKQLFASGMNIGRDIIGSMVNTLILAYSGASLSIILVFTSQKEDFPLLKIMNMEFIGAEITRSLAGLFGMILTIPLTAFIASRVFGSDGNSDKD